MSHSQPFLKGGIKTKNPQTAASSQCFPLPAQHRLSLANSVFFEGERLHLKKKKKKKTNCATKMLLSFASQGTRLKPPWMSGFVNRGMLRNEQIE